MEIACPYCVNATGTCTGNQVKFSTHKIEHANNGPMTEFCPMSGKTLFVTDVYAKCQGCEQNIRILKYVNGKSVLAGHHFSWGKNASGENIKVAPHGGYFSRVMCNSHVGESSVFVSTKLLEQIHPNKISAPAELALN